MGQGRLLEEETSDGEFNESTQYTAYIVPEYSLKNRDIEIDISPKSSIQDDNGEQLI